MDQSPLMLVVIVIQSKHVKTTDALFTQDYFNWLLIGFVAKRLESGLIASAFTHSLASRLRSMAILQLFT